MMALVNPGDEVIYPDPGYPIYSSAVSSQVEYQSPSFYAKRTILGWMWMN